MKPDRNYRCCRYISNLVAGMDVTSLLDLSSVYPVKSRPYSPVTFYRGIYRDGKAVALKVTKPYALPGVENARWKRRREEVARIWSECMHPNVVELIGKATCEFQNVVVYEWHEYGHLYEYLGSQPNADRFQLHQGTQICKGVAYLHGNDIVSVLSVFVRICNFKGRLIRSYRPQGCAMRLPHLHLPAMYLHWAWNGEHLPTPADLIPRSKAGDIVWSNIRKCLSYNAQDRPSVIQVRDAVSLPLALIVPELIGFTITQMEKMHQAPDRIMPMGLKFPELHPSWELSGQHFMLNSGTIPGEVVYTKLVTLHSSHVITFGLEFSVRNNPNQRPCVHEPLEYKNSTTVDYRVLAHTQRIFFHISVHSGEGTIIIPWSNWGTHATRWFVEDGSMEHLMLDPYRSQYTRYTTIKSTETQMLSIVDFNSRVIKLYAYKSEKAVILCGQGLTAGRSFQTRISSPKISIPTIGKVLDHQVITDVVTSEMKTVIRVGFKDPVASWLPYRVVTKLQRMPLHGRWETHGEYLIGTPKRDWDAAERPPLSLYKLELPLLD
ncbi:protein tyrosine kinase domain-containing protein [Rhizoctonia solani AG-1 IA]|uniref:Protein tyrosine kinase domain-containing protein n=1 Tax=Thanatephorus cucumeris (strain AG1-IA) TaxID=983506 RepID=L8WRR8_THACA|nr:protein tyrosine kinase domain-containing protein [Rhizoctonia solani AG-1 IA]